MGLLPEDDGWSMFRFFLQFEPQRLYSNQSRVLSLSVVCLLTLSSSRGHVNNSMSLLATLNVSDGDIERSSDDNISATYTAAELQTAEDL